MGKTKKYTLFKAIFRYSLYIYIYKYIFVNQSFIYYYCIEEAHGEALRFFSPRCHIMPKWVHVP